MWRCYNIGVLRYLLSAKDSWHWPSILETRMAPSRSLIAVSPQLSASTGSFASQIFTLQNQ